MQVSIVFIHVWIFNRINIRINIQFQDSFTPVILIGFKKRLTEGEACCD